MSANLKRRLRGWLLYWRHFHDHDTTKMLIEDALAEIERLEKKASD